MARPDSGNPTRTGIFGIALVACLVLVSFGYTNLPFWPQGKNYEAFFTDAGGITPGNDVAVSGIKVGKVSSVELAGDAAKVTFTVDRHVKVGDQSLVAIKTDTVLGQKSLSVTPGGTGNSTSIPLGRTTTPYTLNTALQDLGENAGELDKPKFEQALQTLTDTLHDATPQLRGALDGVANLSRSLNERDEALEQLLTHAKRVSDTLAQRAGPGEPVDHRRQPAVRRARRTPPGAEQPDRRHRRRVAPAFGLRRRQPARVRPRAAAAQRGDGQPARNARSTSVRRCAGCRRTRPRSARSSAPGPGFQINLYGLPPATISEVLLDTYFQPGKLPDSLADMLRGYISERLIIRPKSP